MGLEKRFKEEKRRLVLQRMYFLRRVHFVTPQTIRDPLHTRKICTLEAISGI